MQSHIPEEQNPQDWMLSSYLFYFYERIRFMSKFTKIWIMAFVSDEQERLLVDECEVEMHVA